MKRMWPTQITSQRNKATDDNAPIILSTHRNDRELQSFYADQCTQIIHK